MTRMTKWFLGSVALFAAMAQLNLAISAEMGNKAVDEQGNISLPSAFRMNMIHLGSWFVPEGGASGFHDVFTTASAASYYRENGKFPDGAVLVKELRAHDSGDYTTGQNVSHSNTTIKQWFVMVKDQNNQFSDRPDWGNGWGWALFKPDSPEQNVVTDYQKDCLGSHLPATATDLVYVEAYPTLSESK